MGGQSAGISGSATTKKKVEKQVKGVNCKENLKTFERGNRSGPNKKAWVQNLQRARPSKREKTAEGKGGGIRVHATKEGREGRRTGRTGRLKTIVGT